MAESQVLELTLQDFGQLPLRALVGLAVRCARRVLPVLRNAPDVPEKRLSLKKVDAALQLAEDFARDQIIWLDQFAAVATEAYQSADESLGEGQYVGCAAGHAASAAGLAHQLLRSRKIDDAMELVAAAWGAYRVLLSFVRGPIRRDYFTGDMVVNVVHAEYERLVALGLGRFGQAGQPLDASEQGPLGLLWPEGLPSWYE